MSPSKVALVGAGYVSRYHLRALQTLPAVKVIALADCDLDKAREMAAAFRVPRVCASIEELAQDRPDVIHILTPPASHFKLAMAALDLGCHVLVEKPLAMTAAECDRLIARAREVGRVLSVNHSARFDPAFLRAVQLVRSGAIGDIVAVDYIRGSEYPAYAGGPVPAHYREGGYPLRDLGVHALYLIETLLGPIVKADAQYRSTGRHPHLPYDEWRLQVECEKGSAQAHLSWNSRPMRNTLLIQGTAGAIEVDFFLETCSLQRSLPGPKVASLVWNGTAARLGGVFRNAWNVVRFATGRLLPSADLHNAVREFHLALQSRGEAFVPAEEGRRMVDWVDRIASRADLDHRRRLESRPAPKPASVLVTGASGFLGRKVVEALLARGQSVRLLVRRELSESLARNPNVSFVQGDLGNPDVVDRAVAGVETVYHVGAAMNGGPAEYQAGTITGTRNVVESALRHGVQKFIYVSSLSVLDYAGLRKRASVDESAAWEPAPQARGLYTSSKLEAEKIVIDAARNGLPAVILRPGQIFGPGAEKVPPYGTISIGNRWVVMGAGHMSLPLIYIDDVVDALLRAAEGRITPGEIIQLVDPDVIDQKAFLAYVKAKCPDLKIIYAPLPLLYAAACAFEVLGRLLKRQVPLTLYRLKSLRGDIRFTCRRAQERLGWTPRVGIRAGLQRTFGGANTYAAQAL